MSESNANIFSNIRAWAKNRGIYKNGDSKTQTVKLGEEFGELCKAVLKRDDLEVYDAIGDCVVVLTNIIELYELERLKLENEPLILNKIEDCIQGSYNVIAQRTGSMKNGTFIKDE